MSLQFPSFYDSFENPKKKFSLCSMFVLHLFSKSSNQPFVWTQEPWPPTHQHSHSLTLTGTILRDNSLSLFTRMNINVPPHVNSATAEVTSVLKAAMIKSKIFIGIASHHSQKWVLSQCEAYRPLGSSRRIVKLMYLLCKVQYAEYVHTCIYTSD